MRGIITRPPRLGFPLLLSTVLSASTVVLHFISEPISSGSFILICVAINNAYFLVRYFQRCTALKRDMLAGANTWPVVPLFPGQIERNQFASSMGLGLWYLLIFGGSILPSKKDRQMRWPGDAVGTALATAFFLELAISAVVYMQARRVRKAEHNVLCAVAHAMRCQRCNVDEAALNKRQAPIPANFHLRTTNALTLSMALSLVVCGTLIALSPIEPDIMWAPIAAAGLTDAQRAFFLARAKFAQPVNQWPSTRLFPGKMACKTFYIANLIAFQFSLFTAIYVFCDDRFAWNAGMLARSVRIAPLFVFAADVSVIVYGAMMDNYEARVECAREGHHWKCVRWCSVAQDTEASDGETGVTNNEKTIIEMTKEDPSASSA